MAAKKKAAKKKSVAKAPLVAARRKAPKPGSNTAKTVAKSARNGKTAAAVATAKERRPGRPMLHGLWLSIPACKVGLALRMMDVAFDYRHVDLMAGAAKTASFLAKNRFGQVPVLEHDGHFIAQSNVILQYLADTYEKFAGHSAAEEIRIAEWLQWDQDRMPAINTARFLLRFQKATSDDPVVKFMTARAVQALDMLDRQLGLGKFVAGSHPTVADIAIFCTVSIADEAGLEISRWPNVQAWVARIMKLPGASHPYDAMPREDRDAA
jgi:glutathione S-transferase